MTVGRSVRVTLRGLARRPGWTAAAIVTLALGIGANATMFTVVDRLLLQAPPQVADPGRVVRVGVAYGAGERRFVMSTTSLPVLHDLRGVAAFGMVAATSGGTMVLGSGADARQIPVQRVTGEYFTLLGVRPSLGRLLAPADDAPPVGEPVVVISHSFWHRALRGAADAIGRELRLDQRPYRIIGVAPAAFRGDGAEAVDAWVPLNAGMAGAPPAWRTARFMNVVTVLARLREGASRAAAADEATAIVRGAMTDARGRDDAIGIDLVSLAPGWRERRASLSPQGRIALWVAGMSVVVLAIAIVNVATLLLLRGAERRQESAVRLALGASRGQLARQLLGESLTLALLGGVVALALALWGSELVRAVLLPSLARAEGLLSWRLLGMTGAATLVAGGLAGLLPALRAGDPAQIGDLRGAGAGAGRARTRAFTGLLVAQGALCMTLLIAAALFVLSLRRVRSQDFGFTARGVLFAQLELAGSPGGPVSDAIHRDAAERLRALPGVTLVTPVQAAPFAGHHTPPIAVPGRPDFPDVTVQVPSLIAAGPEYFRVLGITLRAGRAFTAADREGSPLVVIVNQAMAEGLWPSESALGKCIRIGHAPGAQGIVASPMLPCREIVGVVANARRRSIREEPGQAAMHYYVPFGQMPPAPAFAGPQREIWGLLARVTDDEALAVPVQRTLQGLDGAVAFADVRALQDVLDRQMRPWRLGATMFTLFGVLALALAAIGLYSVRSYTVAQRTREIGVRIALGARQAGVVRLILLEGVRVTVAGVLLGAGAATFFADRLEPLLFETPALHPGVFTGVTLLLGAVSVAASAIPAWRAARVDPCQALRTG